MNCFVRIFGFGIVMLLIGITILALATAGIILVLGGAFTAIGSLAIIFALGGQEE
jgi:hypothetical protein